MFQRTILRRILKIRWPEKISNDELYERTKSQKWSKVIKARRLHWFGHLMRLHEETPAKRAYKEATRPCLKPQGRQKTTWLDVVYKDLEGVILKKKGGGGNNGGGGDYISFEQFAQNRHNWRNLISHVMSRDGRRKLRRM